MATSSRVRAWLVPAVLLFAAGCAGVRRAPPGPEPPQPGVEEGLASFYGHAHQGKRTASGERFDARKLTCAHPTLPFGTRLKVTDLETGRSVVVRVNDRGPYVKGRVVDLSLAAARALGIVDRGIVRVRIEPISGPEDDEPRALAGARARTASR